MALRRSAAGGGRILHPFDVLVAVRTPTPALPRKRRAIAYGIFNESSLRTQGPQRERKLRSSRRRGLSFLHWSRGLLSLLRPGVMGPCVRRDDPPRDCAKPRHRLKLVICDSPALAGEGWGGGARRGFLVRGALKKPMACSARGGQRPSSELRRGRRRSGGGARPGTFPQAGSIVKCRLPRASGSPGR